MEKRTNRGMAERYRERRSDRELMYLNGSIPDRAMLEDLDKSRWREKWEWVQEILEDVSSCGSYEDVGMFRLFYDDADSIYEAAKEYCATRSKKRNRVGDPNLPPNARNVIMFRDWYEEEYLRKQTVREIENKGGSVFEARPSRMLNYMREYPCGLISGAFSLEQEIEESGLSYMKMTLREAVASNVSSGDSCGESSRDLFCVIDNRFPSSNFKKLMCHWCEKHDQDAVLISWSVDRREVRAHAEGQACNGRGEAVGQVIGRLTTQEIEAYLRGAFGEDVQLEKKATVHTKHFHRLYSAAGMQIGSGEFRRMYPELSRRD